MSMEQNENRDVQEEPVLQTEHPSERNGEELSEAEKQEILSVFSETNENKRRRTGFRMTIRNQLILIGGVLLAVALLLGVYFLFLKEEEPLPAFYQLDAQTVGVLDALDDKVEITFCNRTAKDADAEANPDFYRIYTYASLYAGQTRHVKLSFDSKDAYNGVKLTLNGQTRQIPYSEFYRSRLIDGATYGFCGETLLTDAILELSGKQPLQLPVRALDGYDADGNDVLSNGRIVVFPMVNREDISFLTVRNAHGEYSVYQQKAGTFYFTGCELLTYDSELFSSLLVDCRYMIADGKVEDRLGYEVYGLDKQENLTCSYMILTNEKADGTFLFHQIWVGKKASSGAYYYAMYFGGKMDSNQKVLEQYSSPSVFLIPSSYVENNLSQPVEHFFQAQLAGGFSNAEDLYKVDQIQMDYYQYGEEKQPLSIKVLNLPVLSFSENTSSNSGSGDLLKDKKTYADSKRSYTDWTAGGDSEYLVGLTSSDKKTFTISAAVTNTAADGVYECVFGLAKDTDNRTYRALMPADFTVRYTTDGVNYRKLSNLGLDFDAQKEDSVQEYRFRIESDEPILKIELNFTMPDQVGYLVMDEIRVLANGGDAVPNDALTGLWRMISPDSMIPDGKNYAYLDSTNFSDFLYGLCSLKGDSVAKVGISKRGEDQSDDIIDQAALAEFGLDQPSMHFSYVYDGYKTDLYVSAYDEENGCYYAYSTITGDVYSTGRDVLLCTGLIARITTETAAWLEWDPIEYVDHTLVGMYVYEIKQMTITQNGQEYVFDMTAQDKTLTSVRWGDKELDEESFRFLYLSIVQLSMKDTYVAAPGDEPTEYLRIRIKTSTDEKEFVFYRVSSSRAYYTVNGSGSYYCLLSSLRNVTGKLEQFLAGEKVGK